MRTPSPIAGTDNGLFDAVEPIGASGFVGGIPGVAPNEVLAPSGGIEGVAFDDGSGAIDAPIPGVIPPSEGVPLGEVELVDGGVPPNVGIVGIEAVSDEPPWPELPNAGESVGAESLFVPVVNDGGASGDDEGEGLVLNANEGVVGRWAKGASPFAAKSGSVSVLFRESDTYIPYPTAAKTATIIKFFNIFMLVLLDESHPDRQKFRAAGRRSRPRMSARHGP